MTAREQEEAAIRAACAEAGYVGLGVIALADGLSLATVQKLIAYCGLMTVAAARAGASAAATLAAIQATTTDGREH
jgi:hypothetical protein